MGLFTLILHEIYTRIIDCSKQTSTWRPTVWIRKGSFDRQFKDPIVQFFMIDLDRYVC